LGRRISPSRDQHTSHSLRRYTAVPVPLLDEQIAPVENRSCFQKTSDPNAIAEPASPPAGPDDPTPSGCQAFAPHRPAWGFPPASPLSARRSRSTTALGCLASAV